MDIAKLPTAAYVCITLVVLAIIGSMTYLSATGADSTEIRQVFNTLANGAGLAVASIGAIGSTIAARRASQSAQQTNGGLEDRIRRILRSELERGTDGA